MSEISSSHFSAGRNSIVLHGRLAKHSAFWKKIGNSARVPPPSVRAHLFSSLVFSFELKKQASTSKKLGGYQNRV